MSNVYVAVRCRPLLDREPRASVVDIEGQRQERICVRNVGLAAVPDVCDSRARVRTFNSFSRLYGPTASQQQIFEEVGQQILVAALKGYNVCVFAYGQTASGKTFTMMGDTTNGVTTGLIPRVCASLLTGIPENHEAFNVDVSYLEIYNEKVRDLLTCDPSRSEGDNLCVREDPKIGAFVQGLSSHRVYDNNTVQALIDRGNSVRTTASTIMNERSSRSHAIFTLNFAQVEHVEDKDEDFPPNVIRSKIHFVDLAGSERISAFGSCLSHERMKERGCINKSLVVLGNVIRALVRRAKAGARFSSKHSSAGEGSGSSTADSEVMSCVSVSTVPSRRRAGQASGRPRSMTGGSGSRSRHPSADSLRGGENRQGRGGSRTQRHSRPSSPSDSWSTGTSNSHFAVNSYRGRRYYVPYRHSVLTWLLKNSLGGNSKMIMIACVSPSETCYTETVSTLRFAQTVQCLSDSFTVTVNEDGDLRAIGQLKTEIFRLRGLLLAVERSNSKTATSNVQRHDRIALLEQLVNTKMKAIGLYKAWHEKWHRPELTLPSLRTNVDAHAHASCQIDWPAWLAVTDSERLQLVACARGVEQAETLFTDTTARTNGPLRTFHTTMEPRIHFRPLCFSTDALHCVARAPPFVTSHSVNRLDALTQAEQIDTFYPVVPNASQSDASNSDILEFAVPTMQMDDYTYQYQPDIDDDNDNDKSTNASIAYSQDVQSNEADKMLPASFLHQGNDQETHPNGEDEQEEEQGHVPQVLQSDSALYNPAHLYTNGAYEHDLALDLQLALLIRRRYQVVSLPAASFDMYNENVYPECVLSNPSLSRTAEEFTTVVAVAPGDTQQPETQDNQEVFMAEDNLISVSSQIAEWGARHWQNYDLDRTTDGGEDDTLLSPFGEYTRLTLPNGQSVVLLNGQLVDLPPEQLTRLFESCVPEGDNVNKPLTQIDDWAETCYQRWPALDIVHTAALKHSHNDGRANRRRQTAERNYSKFRILNVKVELQTACDSLKSRIMYQRKCAKAEYSVAKLGRANAQPNDAFLKQCRHCSNSSVSDSDQAAIRIRSGDESYDAFLNLGPSKTTVFRFPLQHPVLTDANKHDPHVRSMVTSCHKPLTDAVKRANKWSKIRTRRQLANVSAALRSIASAPISFPVSNYSPQMFMLENDRRPSEDDQDSVFEDVLHRSLSKVCLEELDQDDDVMDTTQSQSQSLALSFDLVRKHALSLSIDGETSGICLDAYADANVKRPASVSDCNGKYALSLPAGFLSSSYSEYSADQTLPNGCYLQHDSNQLHLQNATASRNYPRVARKPLPFTSDASGNAYVSDWTSLPAFYSTDKSPVIDSHSDDDLDDLKLSGLRRAGRHPRLSARSMETILESGDTEAGSDVPEDDLPDLNATHAENDNLDECDSPLESEVTCAYDAEKRAENSHSQQETLCRSEQNDGETRTCTSQLPIENGQNLVDTSNAALQTVNTPNYHLLHEQFTQEVDRSSMENAFANGLAEFSVSASVGTSHRHSAVGSRQSPQTEAVDATGTISKTNRVTDIAVSGSGAADGADAPMQLRQAEASTLPVDTSDATKLHSSRQVDANGNDIYSARSFDDSSQVSCQSQGFLLSDTACGDQPIYHETNISDKPASGKAKAMSFSDHQSDLEDVNVTIAESNRVLQDKLPTQVTAGMPAGSVTDDLNTQLSRSVILPTDKLCSNDDCTRAFDAPHTQNVNELGNFGAVNMALQNGSHTPIKAIGNGILNCDCNSDALLNGEMPNQSSSEHQSVNSDDVSELSVSQVQTGAQLKVESEPLEQLERTDLGVMKAPIKHEPSKAESLHQINNRASSDGQSMVDYKSADDSVLDSSQVAASTNQELTSDSDEFSQFSDSVTSVSKKAAVTVLQSKAAPTTANQNDTDSVESADESAVSETLPDVDEEQLTRRTFGVTSKEKNKSKTTRESTNTNCAGNELVKLPENSVVREDGSDRITDAEMVVNSVNYVGADNVSIHQELANSATTTRLDSEKMDLDSKQLSAQSTGTEENHQLQVPAGTFDAAEATNSTRMNSENEFGIVARTACPMDLTDKRILGPLNGLAAEVQDRKSISQSVDSSGVTDGKSNYADGPLPSLNTADISTGRNAVVDAFGLANASQPVTNDCSIAEVSETLVTTKGKSNSASKYQDYGSDWPQLDRSTKSAGEQSSLLGDAVQASPSDKGKVTLQSPSGNSPLGAELDTRPTEFKMTDPGTSENEPAQSNEAPLDLDSRPNINVKQPARDVRNESTKNIQLQESAKNALPEELRVKSEIGSEKLSENHLLDSKHRKADGSLSAVGKVTEKAKRLTDDLSDGGAQKCAAWLSNLPSMGKSRRRVPRTDSGILCSSSASTLANSKSLNELHNAPSDRDQTPLTDEAAKTVVAGRPNVLTQSSNLSPQSELNDSGKRTKSLSKLPQANSKMRNKMPPFLEEYGLSLNFPHLWDDIVEAELNYSRGQTDIILDNISSVSSLSDNEQVQGATKLKRNDKSSDVIAKPNESDSLQNEKEAMELQKQKRQDELEKTRMLVQQAKSGIDNFKKDIETLADRPQSQMQKLAEARERLRKEMEDTKRQWDEEQKATTQIEKNGKDEKADSLMPTANNAIDATVTAISTTCGLVDTNVNTQYQYQYQSPFKPVQVPQRPSLFSILRGKPMNNEPPKPLIRLRDALKKYETPLNTELACLRDRFSTLKAVTNEASRSQETVSASSDAMDDGSRSVSTAPPASVNGQQTPRITSPSQSLTSCSVAKPAEPVAHSSIDILKPPSAYTPATQSSGTRFSYSSYSYRPSRLT